MNDRMVVACDWCALPMCAYALLPEFERAYRDRSYPAPGTHIYEGKEVPGMAVNDWRKLPPLMP